MDDLLALDQSTLTFSEKNQKLHRILLQLDDTIPATQFIATYVETKFVEPDDLGWQKKTSPRGAPAV